MRQRLFQGLQGFGQAFPEGSFALTACDLSCSCHILCDTAFKVWDEAHASKGMFFKTKYLLNEILLLTCLL